MDKKAMKYLVSRITTPLIVIAGIFGTINSAFAQNWVSQSSMNVARVEATTVQYRDDIYVFNGFEPGIKIANSVEKYDAATKLWSIISSTSTDDGSAMTHNGTVRVGADVWLIGGRIGSHPGPVSDRVWIFNLDDNSWRRGPDLPIPGAAGGAALVNNKVHWFGGIDKNASCDVNTHLVYDLGSPSAGWQDITATAGMPTPRNHFSTAVVDDIIYAIGGQFGHDGCPGKLTNDSVLVHAFDPQTNDWSTKAEIPTKNSHSEPGTFVYKNEIYTAGGENALDIVWKYSPSVNNWSIFKLLPESLVAPVARIVDGHLIIAGGGAPRAALAIDTVRSILVDNNPPTTVTEIETTTESIPAPGSNTPEGDTLISVEAEHFDVDTKTSTHQWVHLAVGQSSNDDAMITTPDQGELAGSAQNTPMLSYMVYFNYPGKHYIWVRGLGDTNELGQGNSDSVQIGLNGAVADTAYNINEFSSQWTWSRNTPSDPVATLNIVSAGVNIVNFWMREDGLAIDKFVITSDPEFVPNGYGPDVTDGTDDYDTSRFDNNEEIDIADQGIANDNPSADDLNDANDASEATDYNEVTDDNDVNYANDADHVNNADDITSVTGTDDVDVNSDMPDQIDQMTDNTIESGTDLSSSKGLFAGSASTSTLFLLLALIFTRVFTRIGCARHFTNSLQEAE